VLRVCGVTLMIQSVTALNAGGHLNVDRLHYRGAARWRLTAPRARSDKPPLSTRFVLIGSGVLAVQHTARRGMCSLTRDRSGEWSARGVRIERFATQHVTEWMCYFF